MVHTSRAHTVQRRILACLVSILALAGVLGLAAGPAAAAQQPAVASESDPVVILSTKSCSTYLTTWCNSPSIRPYADGHITYFVTTSAVGCSYRVKDTVNGNVLRSGRIYFSGGGAIFGLTNWYRIELYSCPPGSLGSVSGA